MMMFLVSSPAIGGIRLALSGKTGNNWIKIITTCARRNLILVPNADAR
jgi:hypothetical protein